MFGQMVGEGQQGTAPVMSHDAVFTFSGCNIRTRGRAAIKCQIYQNCVGRRINKFGWGGFRKIQTIKTSHSLSSVHYCFPSFPYSFFSVLLRNLMMTTE